MAIVLDGNNLTTTGMINSFTAVNSTSGTSIDFTGIPTGVKRVTIMLNGVSTNGTSPLIVRIGSGSILTTGYASSLWQANTTNVTYTGGFQLLQVSIAGMLLNGHIIITNISSNAWIESSIITDTSGSSYNGISAGNINLSGALDRVRITTVNGTDTFDAGSINVLYE